MRHTLQMIVVYAQIKPLLKLQGKPSWKRAVRGSMSLMLCRLTLSVTCGKLQRREVRELARPCQCRRSHTSDAVHTACFPLLQW